MHMCTILPTILCFTLNLFIADKFKILTGGECIFKRPELSPLIQNFNFISSSFPRTKRCGREVRSAVTITYLKRNEDEDFDLKKLEGVSGEEDYKSVSERIEKENVDYIDNNELNGGDSKGQTEDSQESADKKYFDWDSITKSSGLKASKKEQEETKTVTTNLDGKSKEEWEEGERPVIYGSGLNSELKVEDYEIGVSNGRLNEWPVEWTPGKKVLSFFPILIDQYSLNPNPLQIGFEDTIRFRGKHVESTFNSILDKLGDKEIYGLCFLSPESLQLAPLAVYAQLLSKKTVYDGSGENLLVTGRVLGRVLINRVVLEEPFIKALVSPYEDQPVLQDPENIPKLVDEIVNLYDTCNAAEAEIMELLEQPYAHTRVKNRTKLFDIIDDRLNKFNIKNDVNQGFAQIAAYSAFDYHLNATERYDALAMQNTEDRLRFVRDTLKYKGKQLNIVKNSPRESLEVLVKNLKNFQNNRDSLYNYPDQQESQTSNKEDVEVGNTQSS